MAGRYSSYRKPTAYPFTPSPPTTTATRCTITWDAAARVYMVNTPYDSNFVEFIKAKIPGKERAWDPGTKTWTVEERWLDVLQLLATELWTADAVKVITREQVETELRVQQEAQRSAIIATLPERERAIYEFITALPFEAVQAAYRKAALALHPDRNPTDGEAMSKLNAAWTKVEKEFSK